MAKRRTIADAERIITEQIEKYEAGRAATLQARQQLENELYEWDAQLAALKQTLKLIQDQPGGEDDTEETS